MKRVLWTMAWTCLLLTGCAETQLQNKQAAMNRWETARNRIHYRLAQDAYDKGQWNLCRDQLGKALSSNVPFVPAQLLAAKLAMREGRYDEAHDFLEMAVKASPDSAEGWFGKALLAERSGDLDTALEAANKAMELDASAPEYLLCVAELQMRSGETDRAIATLEGVGQRYNTHAGVQSALADLYSLKGDYTAAARCLRRIVLTNPDDQETQARLGICLSRGGHHDEALPLLVVANEKNATGAVQSALAYSYLQLGKYAQAEALYSRLFKAEPGNADVGFRLAECYAMQNDDRAAMDRLNQVLRLAPNHGEARALAGYLCYAHGDLAKAEEHLRVAIDQADHPALVALVLTQTLRAAGKDKEADECWAEFGGKVVAAAQSGASTEMAAVKSTSWTMTGQLPKDDVKR